MNAYVYTYVQMHFLNAYEYTYMQTYIYTKTRRRIMHIHAYIMHMYT